MIVLDFKDQITLKKFSHNIIKKQIEPSYRYQEYKKAQLKALKHPFRYNSNGIGNIY